MIGYVNDVASYAVSYDSANVLRRGSSGSSIIERVCFIREEAKSYACRYFKTMGEDVNPALHTWVIVECVAVKVTQF